MLIPEQAFVQFKNSQNWPRLSRKAAISELDSNTGEMFVTNPSTHPSDTIAVDRNSLVSDCHNMMTGSNMKYSNMNILKISVSSIATLCLILLLTACGGGGGGDNNPAVEPGSIDNGGGSGGSSSDRTATLSWVPPTENTDGSSLTVLAGYKIYYGTSIGDYPNVITIDNPGIATYIIDNLPPGYTYYFVITSFDSFGQESEYSDVGSKTISA